MGCKRIEIVLIVQSGRPIILSCRIKMLPSMCFTSEIFFAFYARRVRIYIACGRIFLRRTWKFVERKYSRGQFVSVRHDKHTSNDKYKTNIVIDLQFCA